MWPWRDKRGTMEKTEVTDIYRGTTKEPIKHRESIPGRGKAPRPQGHQKRKKNDHRAAKKKRSIDTSWTKRKKVLGNSCL